jgi:hypothetical protein
MVINGGSNMENYTGMADLRRYAQMVINGGTNMDYRTGTMVPQLHMQMVINIGTDKENGTGTMDRPSCVWTTPLNIGNMENAYLKNMHAYKHFFAHRMHINISRA